MLAVGSVVLDCDWGLLDPTQADMFRVHKGRPASPEALIIDSPNFFLPRSPLIGFSPHFRPRYGSSELGPEKFIANYLQW